VFTLSRKPVKFTEMRSTSMRLRVGASIPLLTVKLAGELKVTAAEACQASTNRHRLEVA
jgi:hypothetical protein